MILKTLLPPHWTNTPDVFQTREGCCGVLQMICSCGFLLFGSVTVNAQVIATEGQKNEAVTQSPASPSIDISRLEPRSFLQELVARNLEVQYSRLNTDVTRHLGSAEAGIYEPTFFTNVRKEGRNRQRTIEEIGISNAGLPVAIDRTNSYESGIRSKLPTGADISLSYKRANKRSNIIERDSSGLFGTEYSNLLNVNLKQPLLRNAGRSITETDKKIAELEFQASLQQLTQQTLKTSIDGLNLYWQLHRSQETVRLRKEALATAKALFSDAQARITAGRTPSSALLELDGVALNREAELLRGMQALRESQSKLSTALDRLWENDKPAATSAQLSPIDLSLHDAQPSLDDMLLLWSPYQVALVRRQQAQLRLDYARNQKKPVLDFVMSYGSTGLGYNPSDAKSSTMGGKFPDWYVGLNLEVPIGGNQKATEQFLAQTTRLEQAELELQAIRHAFVNDLTVKLGDLQNAHSVLKLSDNEVKLRQSIFDNERIRVNIGSGLLGSLIQKQTDLIEAQQRLLENQVRYEIALATWQYTRGSLLTDNGIQVTGPASYRN